MSGTNVKRLQVLVVVLNILQRNVQCNSGRGLLGEKTEFDEDKLRAWGVPQNAELLVQSRSSCGRAPPVQTLGKMAFLCGAFTKIRACMNLTDTEPFVRGSGCRGQRCHLRLNSKDERAASVCALRHLSGSEIDTKNRTRKSTCGLDPADAHWLDPFQNPANSGKVSCVGPYPKDSVNLIWAACENNFPVYQQNLTFSSELTDRAYTCIVAPQCRKGAFIGELLCYTGRVGGKRAEGGKTRLELGGGDSNGQGVRCLAVFPVLFGMMDLFLRLL